MLKRSRVVSFSYLEKKRLIDRIIKKIKKENEYEFNYWCNRDKIDKMTEKIENNWKVNLVFLESNFCSFLIILLEKKRIFPTINLLFVRVTFTVMVNINKSIYILTKSFMASRYTQL